MEATPSPARPLVTLARPENTQLLMKRRARKHALIASLVHIQLGLELIKHPHVYPASGAQGPRLQEQTRLQIVVLAGQEHTPLPLRRLHANFAVLVNMLPIFDL